MSPKSGVQSPKFDFRFLEIFCLLPFAFCLFSCGSVPNLEKPECGAARNEVREFYSQHFDNGMPLTKENLPKQARFLSGELNNKLNAEAESATDYFTATDDYPKAFRVGSCEVVAPDRAVFGVLLFWKTETRSEQREIRVEAVNENGKWLIDRVGS